MSTKKNYVVFDLETTGLSKTDDHIIQFAGIKYNKETNEIVDSKNIYIQPRGNYTISIVAYMTHHIHPDFLKDKPYIEDVADEIINFFEDSDIVTFNGNSFDISFLTNELKNINKEVNFLEYDCYDVFLEEKRRNGLRLGEVYKRYNDGKTMEEDGLTAHDAFSDVKATYNIFMKQMKDKEYEPEKMVTDDNMFSYHEFEGKEQVCFNIGKYRNLPLTYVETIDKGYMNWIINKSDASAHSKNYVKLVLDHKV